MPQLGNDPDDIVIEVLLYDCWSCDVDASFIPSLLGRHASVCVQSTADAILEHFNWIIP